MHQVNGARCHIEEVSSKMDSLLHRGGKMEVEGKLKLPVTERCMVTPAGRACVIKQMLEQRIWR